jgi:basic membrane protein A
MAMIALGTAAPRAGAHRHDTAPQVVLLTSGCEASNFICDPFKRALAATRVTGRIVAPDVREDPVGTLSLLARQGYRLVLVDITHLDALAIVARRFPKTHFAFFDGPLDALGSRPRNVEAVVLQPNEAAFLAGWLAARLEQRRAGKDVVGAVGGVRTPPVDDFIEGFAAGARSADPHIHVLRGYSGDFLDPNKCAAIARSQIENGAGTVFDVAGNCGRGVLQAAREAGVWGIGVDSDLAFLGRHILTSVVKNYEAGFLALLRQVRDGEFRGGVTTTLALRDGGASLGRISPKVPPSLRAELRRVRSRILAGTIHVPLAKD